jgi:hypothetical protein
MCFPNISSYLASLPLGGRGVRLPLNVTGELVRVEPFRDRYGLDWRIVVTMLGAVGVF